MSTKIEICNLALREVGEQEIQSLSETSKNAKICNRFFESVYDEVLRLHNWNCALFRTELAQDSDTPDYGWTYQYTLPADPYCLRVLRMEDTDYEWVIEGRKLLTDEGTAKILYIGRVADPDKLDPLCTRVIVLTLAYRMAYTLTENATLRQIIKDDLRDAWSDARSMDANEGTKMQTHNSKWLQSRYQGIGAGINRNNVR